MKMTLIKIVSVLGLALSFSTAFAGDIKADREAVNAACTQESSAAGCGTEKVGTGLLKCLHAYKKVHKDFNFSDGCKSAMKTLHADRKEKKVKK